MSEEEITTVTIDGVKYNAAELNDEAVYVVSQLQFLNSAEDKIKQKLDRNTMAKKAFTAMLKEEVKDLTPLEED
tara:strand:+ start:145 stop:366 length:222 start_codon:yes stop_codon:yes gene_type:complete